MAKGDTRARSEVEFAIDIPPLWPQFLLNPENLYIRSQRAAGWNQNRVIFTLWFTTVSLQHSGTNFSFFLFYFILLYNTVWFCHTSTWIHHGCICVPNPEPPSHLPLHTISLGHPSAQAPSILYPASNIDWQFVSYMIVYMFQCHSPKSSHPLPLPQKLI